MLVFLLPVYYLLSEYDVNALLLVIFAFAAMRFFTVLWAVADYLDAQLFLAMYPDATLIGSLFTLDTKRLVLDMTLSTLYLLAPVVLLWIMAMAGKRIGSAASGDGLMQPVQGIGQEVGRLLPGRLSGRK